MDRDIVNGVPKILCPESSLLHLSLPCSPTQDHNIPRGTSQSTPTELTAVSSDGDDHLS